jgi:hypothetical protein|nr:MAG TPA: hypothetical protein [Caudoviricetes sp.]
MDIVTLALTKRYTEKSLLGAGALKGEKGDKGDKGDIPVKGTDYFTADDIDSIVNAVFERVVDGNEVAY